MRPASHSGLRPVQLLLAVLGWWTWAPACTTRIGAVPILEMIWEIRLPISTRTSWVALRLLRRRLLLLFLRSDLRFLVVSESHAAVSMVFV